MLTKTELEAIAQLQFFASDVVQGLAIGHHLSPHRGTSMQFKEHRAYVAGDEIRTLDWKLFGKTDRLYVKQFEDESNLRCMILVDHSGSMAYGEEGSSARYRDASYHDGEPGAANKLEFAVRIAACMATLLIKQQDAVGLASLSNEGAKILPPRSTPNYLKNLMTELATLSPSTPGDSQSSEAVCSSVEQGADLLTASDFVVFISDCFESVEELVAALKVYRTRRRRVLVLQVLHPDELEFPFRQQVQFQSLESAYRKKVNTRAFRRTYLQRFKEFQVQLSGHLKQNRIDFLQFTTDQSLRQVLSEIVGYYERRK